MKKNNELNSFENKLIRQGLGVSFALHLIIFLSFTIKALFFPSEPIQFISAVRVDIVDLPDKLNQLPNQPVNTETSNNESLKSEKISEKNKAQTEAKITQPKNKTALDQLAPKIPEKSLDEIRLEKSKEKQKNALNKLKAIETLEQMKQEYAAEKAAQERAQAIQKIKGTQLSKGTELTGIDKIQHEEYYATLTTHIKMNWALPEWLSNKKLRASVLVKIDKNGRMISRQILKSSGNQQFDEEALSVINKSEPFPIPPQKFIDLMSEAGIIVNFPE